MLIRVGVAVAVCILGMGFGGCACQCAKTASADAAFANTLSADGTTLAYSVYGQGEPTIVFVHGWSCDSRYWDRQVPYFADKYRVVTVDLAGHGHSGTQRQDYTMESFGRDVVAVLEAVDADSAILVGHSMGGKVILHAAALAPGRVIGVIGADTLQDMDETGMSEEDKWKFYEMLAADFQTNSAAMVRDMFTATADPQMVEAIARDMSSAPSDIALSAMRDYIRTSDAALAAGVNVPIKAVNADLWPTNAEANKKYARSYEVAIMKGYGHFIMLEAPGQFNRLLDQMIVKVIKENAAR